MTTRFTRRATLAPTWNAETRTIQVVWSTGEAVVRRDMQGPYVERLSMDAAHVDLSRLQGGPVLLDHFPSARNQIGVIERAWIESGRGAALLKLSARADVAGIVQDIADNIMRNVSIGYSVREWKDTTDSKGNRTRTAVAWTPLELSFVPIAADRGAKTRSAMPETEDIVPVNPANPQTGATPPVLDRATRNTAIRALCESNGMTRAFADTLTDGDGDLIAARAAVNAEMIRVSQAQPPINPRTHNPNPQRVPIELRAEGFAMRYLGHRGSDAARPFANMSAEDQGRAMLEECGVNTRSMRRDELLNALFTRAGQHTQSDFPLMLDIGLGHSVRAAYAAAISPAVALLTIRRTAPDFSEQRIHQLGELPKLPKVSESGEIQSLTRGEARQSARLNTYAGIFSASRQLILGDAFGQLADFTRDAGQSAAGTVADLVVTALTESNGAGITMGDGVRLFHADHANVGGGEIDLDAVSQGRVMLLTQTGVDGETIIDIRPDTLLVPPSQLTLAEQFCTTIAATTTEGVNPLASKLTPVCEPRLEAIDSEAWYLVDSRNPPLVLLGLTGFEGPQVSARDGWEVLGREWRVIIDAGVGPYDFRGVYRSSGGTG